MRCSDIREMLSAYIDEVLDQQEKSAVEQHVGVCGACLQELRELQETVSVLRSLGEVSPPEDFRTSWRTRLEQEPLPGVTVNAPDCRNSIEPPGRWNSLVKWAESSRRYLAVAAVILSIGIGAGIYGLSRVERQPAVPEIALNNRLSAPGSAKSAPVPALKKDAAGIKPDTLMDAQISNAADSLRHAGQENGEAAAEKGNGDAGELRALQPDRTAGNDGKALSGAPAGGQQAGEKTVPLVGGSSEQNFSPEGFLSLEVTNYDQFTRELAVVVGRAGGTVLNYPANSGLSGTGTFIVRVPAAQLTGLMDSIAALGTVKEKEVTNHAAGDRTAAATGETAIRLEVRQIPASRE